MRCVRKRPSAWPPPSARFELVTQEQLLRDLREASKRGRMSDHLDKLTEVVS